MREFSDLYSQINNRIEKIRNSMTFDNEIEFPLLESKYLFDLLFDKEIINLEKIESVYLFLLVTT